VEGTKIVIEVVKATPSVKELIYTSLFFAMGPTNGYIADENQVWLLFTTTGCICLGKRLYLSF
jgi:hypothetical protein